MAYAEDSVTRMCLVKLYHELLNTLNVIFGAVDELNMGEAAQAAPVVHTTQPFRPPFLSSPGDAPIPWDRDRHV